MVTLFIILLFLIVGALGAWKLHHKYSIIKEEIRFAMEFRNIFIEFNNKFMVSSSTGLVAKGGEIDSKKYIWLTMNSNKIQSQIGQMGVMHYVGPFQKYSVQNYQIIINSLAKYRDGQITQFDVNAVDDALLRYLGTIEELSIGAEKNFPSASRSMFKL